MTLVATLHGLTIASREIALTSGLTIAQPDALDGLPERALAPEGPTASEHLVVVLAAERRRRGGGDRARARGARATCCARCGCSATDA